jgi:hydrogenase maturation protease
VNVLVAGVGNIFMGDDGFGSEVIRVLQSGAALEARVEDFGIRGLHLAYELLAGYDRAILVDAVSRGSAAGTLYVIEPDTQGAAAAADAHRMDLESVFAFAQTLGGVMPPLTLVGCEPLTTEDGIGLSAVVAAAVEPAAAIVRRLLARLQTTIVGERETRCSAT